MLCDEELEILSVFEEQNPELIERNMNFYRNSFKVIEKFEDKYSKGNLVLIVVISCVGFSE